MVDKKRARAQQGPTNWRRVILALVGLVLAFVLINGGLNLLSHPDNQPSPSPRTAVPRTTPPGSPPGTNPGSTPTTAATPAG